MMTQLREKTGIVLWVVIVAFVGLIVVEWGADYSSSGQESGADAVGVINGRVVSHREFSERLKVVGAQRTQAGQEVDTGDLVREAWDDLVRYELVRQEIERLGIEVSDSELAHYTRLSPPLDIQALEIFQTDGQFDPAKYSQFITDPVAISDPMGRNLVRYVEQTLRQQLEINRLQSLVMETTQVSPASVKQHFADQNEKVEIEYLFVAATTVAEDEVGPTEAEVQAYFDAHQDELGNEEQVKVAHVFWARVPTSADSALVQEEAAELRQQIVDGADFADLAKAISDDAGSAATGGELGTFGRGRMVKPFEAAAFALKVGEISEPVLSRFGWHIIKLEDRTQDDDGEEQLKARHILMKIRPSRRTEEDLLTRVEEFQEEAARRGLEGAAERAGLEVHESPFLSRDSVVPGLGRGTTALVNLMFANPEGEVSPWASNERGYWIAELTEKRPAGVPPLDEIRNRVERLVEAEKKVAMAGEKLVAIKQQIADGGGFAAAADAAELEVRRPDPFARNDMVPGVGRKNEVVGAAFRLQDGEVSEVINSDRGSYLLHLIERTPVDEGQFEAEREQLAVSLTQQRRAEAWENYSVRIYESAVIEDNRHQFWSVF